MEESNLFLEYPQYFTKLELSYEANYPNSKWNIKFNDINHVTFDPSLHGDNKRLFDRMSEMMESEGQIDTLIAIKSILKCEIKKRKRVLSKERENVTKTRDCQKRRDSRRIFERNICNAYRSGTAKKVEESGEEELLTDVDVND